MRTYFIVIFSLIVTGLLAQKPKVQNDPAHDDKPIHFGFSLGLNTMDYTIRQSQYAKDHSIYAEIADLQPGFHVHAISNLRLAEYLDLRFLPGISFGDRLLHYVDENGDLLFDDGKPYKTESSYLEFPLLLKYKAKRVNNLSPFIISGINTRVDLAAKKEYDARDQLIMIKPLDFYYEIGIGFDFYLVYFKFSTEIKYSAGLRNIFSPTDFNGGLPPNEIAPFSDAIDKIYSSLVMISFHFE
ncbi:MAG: PorT family protein [Bacteroidales bacterium]|nr:PorT family protein [Bacteroidales bacterium]